jgi:hypothetical protein
MKRKPLPQMIRRGLLEAVQSKRKQDMNNELQPIPVFIRIICPTCGRKGVAEKGNKVICETCVNEFLARNVGLMQPMQEDNTKPDMGENLPPSPKGEFIPKGDGQ